MRIFLSLLLLLWVNLAGADISIPALSSPVMDEAGFLAPKEKEDLANLAYEIHTHKGPQITILTVPDLQGYAIEDFSIRVAEKWQLGTKKEGNGLLITISKAERQVRIEVGEGIEGEITDFEANKYINDVIVPSFKAQDYHGGLKAVMVDIANKFNITLTGGNSFVRRAPRRSQGKMDFIFPIIIIIMVLSQALFRNNRVGRGVFSGLSAVGAGYFMLPGLGLGLIFLFILGLFFGLIGTSNLLHAASSGGRYRGGGDGFGGGGFGGGGGWGGGGGGFSGGGSSGRW